MTYEKDIPDYALLPAKQPEERVLTPITQGAVYTPVQVTHINDICRTTIVVEEDLLVPDIRPDLKEVLDITGKVRLASRQLGPFMKAEDTIPLTGEVELQTLYIPEKPSAGCAVISTSSRIGFRQQWHNTIPENTILTLDAEVADIECTVINERKYRVKITLSVTARMCRDVQLEFFEGLTDEEMQTLRDTVEITRIAVRKKDIFAVQEEVPLKDGAAFPETILKQEISVVENYKQATAEKVIINGFIYVSLLYTAEMDGCVDCDAPSETKCRLHHLQERVEFTQFIPLSQSGQWSGCSVTFDGSDLRVRIAPGQDGNEALYLEGDITTWLELYHNVEKEMIIDGYHCQKDFVCDFEETDCRTMIGTAIGEATVREIVSTETHHGDADQILHISASVLTGNCHAEPGKLIAEGTLRIRLICMSADGRIFSVLHTLPYRCVTAVPYLEGKEIICHKVFLKDFWAEKINHKQAEINAGILVSSEIMRLVPLRLLKNPAFEEKGGHTSESRPMVIYTVKEGDSLWSIAKRFQSTMEAIRQSNQMEDHAVQPGHKLLILQQTV